MAAKHPVKTTTNAVTSSQPSLPPAEVFDVLPHLHELLARVDKNESQASLRSNPLAGMDLEDALEDSETASLYNNARGLTPKEIQTDVLNVKARIRSALREVEKLPDVDRTIGEQEEEISELEERIRKQREMLASLAEVAKGVQGKVS